MQKLVAFFSVSRVGGECPAPSPKLRSLKGCQWRSLNSLRAKLRAKCALEFPLQMRVNGSAGGSLSVVAQITAVRSDDDNQRWLVLRRVGSSCGDYRVSPAAGVRKRKAFVPTMDTKKSLTENGRVLIRSAW